MNDEQMTEKKAARGIYLLPSLFTISALFAGFYAVVAATKNLYDTAAIAIFVAMLLDSLDGRVARLVNATSEFGAQLDSLADLVSFGVAPALVLYFWSLHALGKPGWLAAFIYMVGSALRLARFNVQIGKVDKRYFLGLSTTASAGVVAGLVWTCASYDIEGTRFVFLVALFAVALGLLKVSTVPYRSFKDLDLRGKVPFMVILIIVLLIALVSADPADILFAVFASYALSGPVGVLLRWRRRLYCQTSVVVNESEENAGASLSSSEIKNTQPEAKSKSSEFSNNSSTTDSTSGERDS